eukprot:COSAG01_NODE_39455_length_476_cov_0.931034_1_plen_109_part_01
MLQSNSGSYSFEGAGGGWCRRFLSAHTSARHPSSPAASLGLPAQSVFPTAIQSSPSCTVTEAAWRVGQGVPGSSCHSTPSDEYPGAHARMREQRSPVETVSAYIHHKSP